MTPPHFGTLSFFFSLLFYLCFHSFFVLFFVWFVCFSFFGLFFVLLFILIAPCTIKLSCALIRFASRVLDLFITHSTFSLDVCSNVCVFHVCEKFAPSKTFRFIASVSAITSIQEAKASDRRVFVICIMCFTWDLANSKQLKTF